MTEKVFDLLPCPFCGKQDIEYGYIGGCGFNVAFVKCVGCCATVKHYGEIEGAVAIWNSRKGNDVERRNNNDKD